MAQSSAVDLRGAMRRARAARDSGTRAILPAVVQVRFRPAWDQVSALRTYLTVHCHQHGGDRLGERAGLIAQELLENAVNYGDLFAEISVELRIDDDERCFQLRIANDALPARVLLLRKEVERLAQLSPEVGFADAVRRARGQGPGIGLARIRNEAEVDLSVVPDGRRVTVIASGTW